MEKLITFASVDDEAVIKAVMEILPSFNCNLKHCWHSFDAENAIKNFVERSVDVVVIDYRLNMDSGIELLRTIKTIRKETKFVLLSGHLNPQVCHSAMSLGVNAILVKGEPIPFVSKVVADAIGERPIFSEQVKLIVVGAKDRPKISEKEKLILEICTKTKTIKELAFKVGLTVACVDSVLRRIRKKFGTLDRPLSTRELIAKYMNGELC